MANVSEITLVTTVTNPVTVTTPAEHLCLQITVNYIVTLLFKQVWQFNVRICWLEREDDANDAFLHNLLANLS